VTSFDKNLFQQDASDLVAKNSKLSFPIWLLRRQDALQPMQQGFWVLNE